ncbi:MAG: glycosyltransferase [Phycisphaerales bacterium]|nr:glycosyltransferase [Phycisphaerales bacterium]
MRILHISTRLILGGSQENTVLSCEGQARRGHEVHLAFGPIFGPEGSLLERVQGFRADGGQTITTHEVPHLTREINPLADRGCYHELRRLICDLKPDVVHTHSSKAGILGRAAAWAERAPAIVHTIHGPPFHPNLPWHTSRLYIAAERYAAKRCHAIIGVCNAMVEQFVSNRIGKPEQYHTVYSGMETGPYLHAAAGESREQVRAGLGLAPDDFVLGTVARLAEHKGHDDILDALAQDLKSNPNWKLLWVGDGWWRERLIDKAIRLGIAVTELDRTPSPPSAPSPRHPATPTPPQLLLTGLVPPVRIPGLMRAMDVLIHPSYREGLPRTVPQALLCGTCPIAYDTDGTPEACKDMKTGRLIKTGDQAGLREAVRWAAENPVPRAALAARGREECRVRFDAGRMVDELERVYAACHPSTPTR